MKIIFVIILLTISVLLQGQEEKQMIVTSQPELKQLRKKFKNNRFVYQPKENNNTIFDRYINGNKKLIDSIDMILKSKNIESRRLLVNSMYNRPNNFKFDNEIQNIILKNLVCDETNIIWLIGKNKFSGFVNEFENKLPFFSLNCQTDLLYWLGIEGNSEIGFSHLKKLLLSSKIDHYEHSRLQDALYFYIISGNENIKVMAIDLALEIYSSKLIYNYLLKYDEYTAKDFESRLLHNILTLGGKKIIPIAKSLYDQKKHEENALSSLVLYDHKNYKNELIKRINDDNNEYLGRNASIFYLKASSDISIIPLIIEKYFKNNAHNCARFFLSNNLQNELEISLRTFDDKLFVEKVKDEIEIRTKSAFEVALDLYNFGILKETDTLKYAQNIIEFQKETQLSFLDSNSKIEPYTYLLNHSPVSSNYGWESNEFPIHYDEILHDALKISESDLGKATIYSIANPNEDFSKAVHEIFVDFGEIGINAVHISTSLYPDQKFIIEFLNLISTKNNSKKKFFHDFISESNIIFYTGETVYKNFSNYLKSAYKY